MQCANCGKELEFRRGIEVYESNSSIGLQFICSCEAINQLSFHDAFYETCHVYKKGEYVKTIDVSKRTLP